MTRTGTQIIITAVALLFGAADAAIFYGITSWIFSAPVTWPVVMAVYWLSSAACARAAREQAKKDGLL